MHSASLVPANAFVLCACFMCSLLTNVGIIRVLCAVYGAVCSVLLSVVVVFSPLTVLTSSVQIERAREAIRVEVAAAVTNAEFQFAALDQAGVGVALPHSAEEPLPPKLIQLVQSLLAKMTLSGGLLTEEEKADAESRFEHTASVVLWCMLVNQSVCLSDCQGGENVSVWLRNTEKYSDVRFY